MSRPMEGQRVGIIGGGPAGMLCAAYMAKNGASVTVLERYDPSTDTESGQPRPWWNIGLSQISRTAIEGAGLSAEFEPQFKYAASLKASRTSSSWLSWQAMAKRDTIPPADQRPQDHSQSHCSIPRAVALIPLVATCVTSATPDTSTPASPDQPGPAQITPRLPVQHKTKPTRQPHECRCQVTTAVPRLADPPERTPCRPEGMAVYQLGKPTIYMGTWDPDDNAIQLALITQPGIVQHLTREAERLYGGLIRVQRGSQVVGGNICEGEVIVESPAGSQQALTFDLVVGADGLWSVARSLMQQHVCLPLHHLEPQVCSCVDLLPECCVSCS